MENILNNSAREVWVLAGATGSGKTDVGVVLARRHNAEVVSADSRQIYREFTAGTAKPQRDAGSADSPFYFVSGVRHHLLDFVEPTVAYNAGAFVKDAVAAIDDIHARGKHALVVGGTGLYIKALTEGLAPLPQGDETLRQKYAALAAKDGRTVLHAALKKIDPVSAGAIPANNIQRVIRALEVYDLTGVTLSDCHKNTRPPRPWTYRWAALRWPVPAFRKHIEQRCERLWPELLREVTTLQQRGVPTDAPAWLSLGYREALEACRHPSHDPDAFTNFVKNTFHYIKRQNTWFRGVPNLTWVDVDLPFFPKNEADKISRIFEKQQLS